MKREAVVIVRSRTVKKARDFAPKLLDRKQAGIRGVS
jgi:hypothetical protein